MNASVNFTESSTCANNGQSIELESTAALTVDELGLVGGGEALVITE